MGPSLSPSAVSPWAQKRAIPSPPSPSSLRLVQKRDALTANLNPPGTIAAQRSNSSGFCSL
jgi:hypothetical protein